MYLLEGGDGALARLEVANFRQISTTATSQNFPRECQNSPNLQPKILPELRLTVPVCIFLRLTV